MFNFSTHDNHDEIGDTQRCDRLTTNNTENFTQKKYKKNHRAFCEWWNQTNFTFRHNHPHPLVLATLRFRRLEWSSHASFACWMCAPHHTDTCGRNHQKSSPESRSDF
jgi:hypothetical protein